MQNSTQNMMSLGTIKNDFTQTGILNCTEQLNCSQQNSSDNLLQKTKRYTKNKFLSHTKQNKDGANAARTARITLVSMVLDQNYKQFMKMLRLIGQDLQIKKIMLNIGEKQFKNRYLFRPQLKQFFSIIFENVSSESVYMSMRKNKRSQLDYKSRAELCFQYINNYKNQFIQKYQPKQILIPSPLTPIQYSQYMKSKGFY